MQLYQHLSVSFVVNERYYGCDFKEIVLVSHVPDSTVIIYSIKKHNFFLSFFLQCKTNPYIFVLDGEKTRTFCNLTVCIVYLLRCGMNRHWWGRQLKSSKAGFSKVTQWACGGQIMAPVPYVWHPYSRSCGLTQRGKLWCWLKKKIWEKDKMGKDGWTLHLSCLEHVFFPIWAKLILLFIHF